LSILATDNLDVACAAIEKAAMERAVSDVDEGFAASYEARRRHREVSGRQSCYLALDTYASPS
jgi:CCR4-NOT transcription complex subunit 1